MTDFETNCTCFLDGHEVRGELGVVMRPEEGHIAVKFTVDDWLKLSLAENVPADKACVLQLIPTSHIRPDETVTQIQIGWKTTSAYHPWYTWLYKYHIPLIRRWLHYPYLSHPVYTSLDSFQWYDHPTSKFFRHVKGLE